MTVIRLILATVLTWSVLASVCHAGDRYGDPLPPDALARIGTTRLHHNSRVCAVTFSPDGKTLASADERGHIRLWDADTGRLVGAATHVGSVCALAWTPDGKRIASGGSYWGTKQDIKPDNVVRLWDVSTMKQVSTFGDERQGALFLAISPDGKLLVTGGLDIVHLWSMDGKKLARWANGDKQIHHVAFSPDSKTLAVVARGKVIRQWDVNTRKEVRQFATEADVDGFYWAEFEPDGKTLVATSRDAVHRWDVEGKEVASPKIVPSVLGPNAAWIVHLAEGEASYRMEFWPRPFDKKQIEIELEMTGVMQSLACSPDGRMLAFGGRDGRVLTWDLTTGEPRFPVAWQSDLLAVALSPDGRQRVSAHRDGVVRVWDVDTGREVCCRRGPKGVTRDLAFSPDGSLLAVVAFEGDTELWDARTWGTVRRLASQKSEQPETLRFTPDGKYALVKCKTIYSFDVQLWEVDSAKLVRRFSVDRVWPALDGRTLAVFGQEFALVDIGTGKSTPVSFQRELYEPIVASDGHHIAGIARERDAEYLCVRRLSDGKCIRRVKLVGETEIVASSPDGRYLASDSNNGVVQLWDVLAGKECARFTGHLKRAWSLSFSTDGRTLTSLSADGTALVWDVTGLAGDQKRRTLAQAWDDLASVDAGVARRAVWTFASDVAGPAFLRERVRAAESPTAEQLDALIRGLQADTFAERERSAKSLVGWDEQARTALQKALASATEVESRRRLADVIERIDGPMSDVTLLRSLRAVHALEMAGTADAKGVLEALAKGAADARLTREASASLSRLARRVAK